MISLLEWLLDLRHISLERDAPLLLRWNAQIQAWLLFGLGLIGAVWILVYYRREPVSIGRRILLACVRGALVALVLAALCEPTLVLQRERVERSHVALLVDSSISMAQRDAYTDTAPASALTRAVSLNDVRALEGLTRREIGERILMQSRGALLEQMLAANGLAFSTFSSSVRRIGTAWDATELTALLAAVSEIPADGTSTDLAQAFSTVLDEAQGRRLAAIVLVSDGRHTQASSLAPVLQRAADRQVPVYPLLLGDPKPRFDIEVGPLRADESVFANDILAIEAQVRIRGGGTPASFPVRLIDETTSSVVATQEVTPEQNDDPMLVELRTKPSRTGRIAYRVAVEPLAHERFTDNNADRIVVNVLSERVRVLYVEGAPRYEYRYLKNALVREPTVQVSVLLLEADDRFVQEGTDPIRRFPVDPDELDRYDVLIFGDVDPRGGWLSTAQMEMIVEFVSRRGGGFAVIAGERHAPRFFADTPLKKLIPIRIDPTFLGRYESELIEGYNGRLTDAGRSSRLFRFTEDHELSVRMFDQLPPMYWFARTLGPKPGATVLADHPRASYPRGAMPLIVTGRYGAGKLLFQATDDTWRWRRRSGEALHDAYWVQVVRELMSAGRVGTDRRYVIRTNRKSYPLGMSVSIQVEILDPDLMAQQRDALEVSISTIGSTSEPSAAESQTSPESGDRIATISLRRVGEQSPLYESSYTPPRPGRYVLEPAGIPSGPGENKPHAQLRVERPDLEMRRPEADHETLERIASVTGGRVVEPDEVEDVLLSIRDRSARIPDDIIEPLWDSKLIFIVFVLMISIEWVLRKMFGLV